VSAAAEVELAPEVAWKLFTKGLRLEEARQLVQISDDEKLGLAVLRLVAVMA
jgi:hypothetical protein